MSRPILDIAMIAPIPRSGWKAWRAHMHPKSPSEHPIKHRRVFIPARFQTARDPQNCNENTEGGSVFFPFPLHLTFGVLWVLWVHFGRSWNVVAGVILVKELKWIRPGEHKRAESLVITGCMSGIVGSASSVNACKDEDL